MQHLRTYQEARSSAQRLLTHCPWLPWALPPALVAVCWPVLYAAEHVLGHHDLLRPANHPGVLLALCCAGGWTCVPLYGAARVARGALVMACALLALAAQYAARAAFCAAPRPVALAFGVADVWLVTHACAVALRVAWPSHAEPAATARADVWRLAGSTAPLILVPQVVVLLALAV